MAEWNLVENRFRSLFGVSLGLFGVSLSIKAHVRIRAGKKWAAALLGTGNGGGQLLYIENGGGQLGTVVGVGEITLNH